MKNLNEYVEEYLDILGLNSIKAPFFARQEKLLKHIESMPNDSNTKAELFECIQCYDIIELYIAIFDKCGELLSSKEFYQLKDQYLKTFSLDLPDACTDIERRITQTNKTDEGSEFF